MIERPGQSIETIDLLGYDVVNDDGTFAFDVTELRRLGNNGDNILTIRAGKPINFVVDGAPDEDSRTLSGVLPVINVPAAFTTSSPVLRRAIGSTAFRYSRAFSAVLADEVTSALTGDVTRENLSEVQGVAYTEKTVDVAAVTLPQIPGTHQVGVVASNGFGATIDTGVIFIAPRPIVTTNSANWSIENSNYRGEVFASGSVSGGQTSFRAGNSADSILADVTIANALTVSRRDDGVSRSIADANANTPAGYDPLVQRDFGVRVPRTGMLAADRWTEVRVSADNEFASQSALLRVHRRGNYYFWKGSVTTLNLVNNSLRMDVTVERPDDPPLFFPDEGDFWEHPFPDGRSEGGMPYENIEWEIFRIVEDEDGDPMREPADSDIDVSDAGVAEGPDYELLVPLYRLYEGQVVSGSPTTDWFLVDEDDTDVHFYNPVRVRAEVTSVPVYFYSPRFVDLPFENL